MKYKFRDVMVFTKIDDPFVLVQLIGFPDASPLSYGCIRSGMLNISFISLKSRIAPLKKANYDPTLRIAW